MVAIIPVSMVLTDLHVVRLFFYRKGAKGAKIINNSPQRRGDAEVNSCFVELILMCRSGFNRILSMFVTKVAPAIKIKSSASPRLCGEQIT